MGLERTEAQAVADDTADPEREIFKAALLDRADWLRDDADLLSALGLRVDSTKIIDFGPVALSRVSAERQREFSERRRLEDMARANFAAQTQTHAAVGDVLAARDLEDLARRVDELARVRFGLALAVLALEGGETPAGWRALAPGQTELVLGTGREARLGRLPTAGGLFGDRAPHIQSVALARLAPWSPPRLGVLALGSAEPDSFSDDMGTELLTFLAGVVAWTAGRWPRP
jgi:uncharacterized protein YigA (DUF484 family)